MNIQTKSEPDRLDQLIHEYKSLETMLALAIVNDEEKVIRTADTELKQTQLQIINFDCHTNLERSQLFEFLMENFIESKETLSSIPSGVTERLRQLFNRSSPDQEW